MVEPQKQGCLSAEQICREGRDPTPSLLPALFTPPPTGGRVQDQKDLQKEGGDSAASSSPGILTESQGWTLAQQSGLQVFGVCFVLFCLLEEANCAEGQDLGPSEWES